MRKTCKYISGLVAILMMAACNPDNNPSGNTPQPPANTLPEPPETVVDARVFIVDLFTTLQDGYYFTGRDVSIAAEYIREQQQKLSIVYMFDRADFTVGKSHPMTDISYALGVNPLFAQCGPTTETTTPGTGIVTRYPISDYDGFACEGAFLSGCRISVPITGTPALYVSTSKINSLSQAETIYENRKQRLVSDTVIIGTVATEIRDQVLDFFTSGSLRTTAMGSDGTEYDIIVVTPAEYVCRGFEAGQKVNLPYYRVSIEKWM